MTESKNRIIQIRTDISEKSEELAWQSGQSCESKTKEEVD